jgi:mono/diheme cytochrome c family protein
VRPFLALIALALVALGTAACGSEGISVADSDPNYGGAELFSQRCGGCHTLTPAGTQGSGNRTLRQQGPNFDQRVETYDTALFAIQNGGISGSIMPQNIAVGDDAEAIAHFLAEYAGGDVDDPPRPSPEQGQSLEQQEDSKPNQGVTAGYDSNG